MVPVQDAAARKTATRKAAARGGLDFSAQLVAICNEYEMVAVDWCERCGSRYDRLRHPTAAIAQLV